MDYRVNKFFRYWLNHYMLQIILNDQGKNSKYIRID